MQNIGDKNKQNQHIKQAANREFAVSLLFPWIKGRLDVDRYNVIVDFPNTVFFGLIPAGREQHTSPLGNVSNVYTSNSYNIVRMLFGLIGFFNGLSSIGDGRFFGGLIVLALGVALFLSGLQVVFAYEKNGTLIEIPLPFYEADHVKAYAEEVIAQLNVYNDERNGLLNAQINAQLINDQSRQNAQLQFEQNQAILNAIQGSNNFGVQVLRQEESERIDVAIEEQEFSQEVSNSNNDPSQIINQEEWLNYFELVNGRKPTIEEMHTAKVNGDFR